MLEEREDTCDEALETAGEAWEVEVDQGRGEG